MRDSDRLALARERLCAVQLAMSRLGHKFDAGRPWLAVSAFAETMAALVNLEDALGQPVTPQGLFVEGGAN